jgi:hypothetical protein
MASAKERERILNKAYELWEAEGRPTGRDMEHWFQAEILSSQELSKSKTKAPAKVAAKTKSDSPAKSKEKAAAKAPEKAKAKPAAKTKSSSGKASAKSKS